jgi:hypothetical protein
VFVLLAAAFGFLVTSVIPAFLPGSLLFEVVDAAEVLRRYPELEIERRACPHCGNVVSYVAQTCPKCGHRLYPPLLPITHDKIGILLEQIDKRALTQSPEEYYRQAQDHAWDWRVPQAALELGKVLLTSSPKSDIHRKAERLLKKMGYRF